MFCLDSAEYEAFPLHVDRSLYFTTNPFICCLVLNHLNYYQQLGTLKYCTTEGIIDNNCIKFLAYDNIYHFELRGYLKGKEN
jgi:hypothetical protein